MKILKILKITLTSLVATAFLYALVAEAQDKEVDEVENILDRLEKRLLDQESDSLSFGEKSSIPDIKNQADRQMNFEKQESITGSSPEARELQKIAELIATLEADADRLASNVQKTKQNILSDSKVDNFVTLDARLENPDSASIKSLSVKLDGFPIYELQESSGLWLPSKQIPLYAGPMQPGTHRVDLEVRLSMKHQKGLPLNSDILKIVQRNFEIAIPGGTSGNKFLITLDSSNKSGSEATATLQEVL